jgi:UDP-N-acetylglucosamine 2-epimerase (non-hydrolysing)
MTITEKNLPSDKLLLNNYTLFTLHRNFNVDDPKSLESILIQIGILATKQQIVMPIHPRTLKNIESFNLNVYLENLIVIDPVDYKTMMALLRFSKSVITDSGGLQKEAYFFSKPTFLIMPDTSWRELVDNNYHCLVDSNNIVEMFDGFVSSEERTDFYGNGFAADKIIETLKIDFEKN